jgi:hypothetical protein
MVRIRVPSKNTFYPSGPLLPLPLALEHARVVGRRPSQIGIIVGDTPVTNTSQRPHFPTPREALL